MASASADDVAKDWFERMSRAVEELSYKGTFVHLLDTQMETMEVLHTVRDKRVYERLTSRSGAPREFLRTGEELQCIVQSRKEVLVDLWQNQSPLMSTIPIYREELSSNYDFEFNNQGRQMAGRDTVFVRIVPKDNLRYGYHLWIDRETAMPLGCELVDQNGRLIETIHFTEIEFNPVFAKNDFSPTLNTDDFTWIKPSSERKVVKLTSSRWHAQNMPKGFLLSASRLETAGNNRVEHHVYSDGLATVSIFTEQRAEGEAVMEGATSFGVTNAYGRIEDGFQITVLGEVPVDTVKIIGNSFRPDKR